MSDTLLAATIAPVKKILITGISGFAGSFLAEHLITEGYGEIVGTYNSENNLKNVDAIKNSVRLIKADLTRKEEVERLIEQTRPDNVYHLAAIASVGASFKSPVVSLHNNIDAEIFLLDSLRRHKMLDSRILIVSSAEVYGYVNSSDLPVDEETPLRPANPYAVSKIAQDYLGLQYYISYKMPIIRVRPFNHIGPRQGLGFVVADFAYQVASIEKGEKEPIIHVGNLEAKRDFTDVRDMVRAYSLLMKKGIVGDVYNVGSAVSYKIREILNMLISLSTKKISIKIDQEKFRPGDIPEVVADIRKITDTTGWKPEIQLKDTLKDTLDYWRSFR